MVAGKDIFEILPQAGGRTGRIICRAESSLCLSRAIADLNKVKLRLGISAIYQSINRQLLDAVEEHKPGIIWVFKGMEIWPQTLEWIRSKGIRLVNYNPDNPFIFTGSGSGNRNVTDSIRLFDLHLTYNLAVKKRLEDEYYMRTALLPFGFDLDDEVFPAVQPGGGNTADLFCRKS